MLYNNKYTLLKAGVIVVMTTEESDVSLTWPTSEEAGSHTQTSLQPEKERQLVTRWPEKARSSAKGSRQYTVSTASPLSEDLRYLE